MTTSLRLIVRAPGDLGDIRMLPTPSLTLINHNIDEFLSQWKTVHHHGEMALSPTAITELEKLRGYVERLPFQYSTNSRWYAR